jgi:hypothetical protein
MDIRHAINLLEGAAILEEGVALHSLPEHAAFAVAVAEAYEAAPLHDPSADKHWIAMITHTVETLLPRIVGDGIRLEYTEDDPYTEGGHDPQMMLRYMLYDIAFNRRLFIWSGASDHPVFTPQQNVLFRSIHDFYTHGKLVAVFKKNLMQVSPEIAKGKPPTPQELAKVLPQVSMTKGGNQGHGFTARGELSTAARHIVLAPKVAAPCLFTEVVGQVCYNVVTTKHAAQKVAILPGFDFKNIGQTIPGSVADKRKGEVMAFLAKADPDALLDLHLKERPQIKAKVLINNVKSRDRYSK